jgi:hypothetical protein
MNRSADSRPRPSDFAIGSTESRAAARLQLERLLDSREWVTLYAENDGDKIGFGPWTVAPDNSIVVRIVSLPCIWVDSPIRVVPRCLDCGASYSEKGSFGTTVCFQPTCADRHDPAPPQRNRPRCDSGFVISESEKKRAWQAVAMIHCFESQERSTS